VDSERWGTGTSLNWLDLRSCEPFVLGLHSRAQSWGMRAYVHAPYGPSICIPCPPYKEVGRAPQ